MSEKHLNKDKVIDDLLLLIAKKNKSIKLLRQCDDTSTDTIAKMDAELITKDKRIKELEEEYERLEPTDIPIEGIKFEGVVATGE